MACQEAQVTLPEQLPPLRRTASMHSRAIGLQSWQKPFSCAGEPLQNRAPGEMVVSELAQVPSNKRSDVVLHPWLHILDHVIVRRMPKAELAFLFGTEVDDACRSSGPLLECNGSPHPGD